MKRPNGSESTSRPAGHITHGDFHRPRSIVLLPLQFEIVFTLKFYVDIADVQVGAPISGKLDPHPAITYGRDNVIESKGMFVHIGAWAQEKTRLLGQGCYFSIRP